MIKQMLGLIVIIALLCVPLSVVGSDPPTVASRVAEISSIARAGEQAGTGRWITSKKSNDGYLLHAVEMEGMTIAVAWSKPNGPYTIMVMLAYSIAEGTFQVGVFADNAMINKYPVTDEMACASIDRWIKSWHTVGQIAI